MMYFLIRQGGFDEVVFKSVFLTVSIIHDFNKINWFAASKVETFATISKFL